MGGQETGMELVDRDLRDGAITARPFEAISYVGNRAAHHGKRKRGQRSSTKAH
jgi:hypothetical protein